MDEQKTWQFETMISVRLSRDEVDRIKEQATAKGMTLSAYVRDVIQQHIDASTASTTNYA